LVEYQPLSIGLAGSDRHPASHRLTVARSVTCFMVPRNPRTSQVRPLLSLLSQRQIRTSPLRRSDVARFAEAVDSIASMSSGRCNESANNQLALAALTSMMGS
jgi:hypothetical protein